LTDIIYKKDPNENSLKEKDDAEEKRVRIMLEGNSNINAWVIVTEKTDVLALFTATLDLPKPVKRFWSADGNENMPIQNFEQILPRANLVLS
jgi:hypothetical protein